MRYALFFTILLSCDSFADVDLNNTVDSWSKLGANLPSQDMPKFAAKLPESIDSLQRGLESKNDHVRMSTAYVIEKLGKPASQIAPELIEAYSREVKVINQVYYINALVALEVQDDDYKKSLLKWFNDEKNPQLKTSLAAALLIVSKSNERDPEYRWLVKTVSHSDVKHEEHSEAYYDRWESVLSVSPLMRYFPVHKDEFVALVKVMADHEETPKWVKGHLQRHLKELPK